MTAVLKQGQHLLALNCVSALQDAPRRGLLHAEGALAALLPPAAPHGRVGFLEDRYTSTSGGQFLMIKTLPR